jgi:rod shape-determining protein MreC
MAPPKTRRPGFSRRAQYGLFIGYVVAIGGVLLAILLLGLAIVRPGAFGTVRGASLDVTTPISTAGRSVVRFFTSSGETVGNYFAAASQNAALKRDLEASRQLLVEARALKFENARLKRLLKLERQSADRVATARIVNSTFDASRRLATINAGSRQGVRVGQPVRAPEGLIGRVVETGWTASRVLLLTDGTSNVPVRLARDGTPAIASGRGDGTIEIKPLELGRNPFRRGDIFVTSGTGGIFPPNIPVAIVSQVSRDQTLAQPLANPARIDYAIVETIYQPAANQPLEPSPATPPEPAAPPPEPATAP